MKTANLKPVEIVWATPERMKTHYDVLADLRVKLMIAFLRPTDSLRQRFKSRAPRGQELRRSLVC